MQGERVPDVLGAGWGVTKCLFNSNLAIATFSDVCSDCARLASLSALRWRSARWWVYAGMESYF